MSSDDFSIRVSNLSKSYEIYSAPRDRLKQFAMSLIGRLSGRPVKKYFKEFHALKNISFEIKRGETVGIIGRNGSGKSTLLQIGGIVLIGRGPDFLLLDLLFPNAIPVDKHIQQGSRAMVSIADIYEALSKAEVAVVVRE